VSLAQGAFTLVGFGNVHLPEVPGIRRLGIAQKTADYPCHGDMQGYALGRYGMGMAYLFRPDGHVAAVFERPMADAVVAARDRALGRSPAMQEAVG
jgi:3-(3-hydroxy-phenyl)propionate hydroxylase